MKTRFLEVGQVGDILGGLGSDDNRTFEEVEV